MNWWKQFIISSAVAFFMGLRNSNPTVKAESKKYALEIYQAIKIAFSDDPDFQ